MSAPSGFFRPLHHSLSPDLCAVESYETTPEGDPTHIWELRNRGNGCSDGQTQPSGGCMIYASPPGDCHTSYNLLGSSSGSSGRGPPTDLYKSNPEWFWPRDSPETYGQLCWSNKSLISLITKHDPITAPPPPPANAAQSLTVWCAGLAQEREGFPPLAAQRQHHLCVPKRQR